MESFVRELQVKMQDEKELKMGILLTQFLDYLEERFATPDNTAPLIEQLIHIYEEKIYPVDKLSFT